MQKTIRNWWKKLKTIQTDGAIHNVLGLEESTLWKWLYYPKQSTDSMQSLSNYQWHFSQNYNKKIHNLHWNTKKNTNSQRNIVKEKWSWRNQPPWLQIILQRYRNQDSMVVAQKQKHRSMEQDRKPRDQSTHLWSTNLWQRRQGYTMEKSQSLQ